MIVSNTRNALENLDPDNYFPRGIAYIFLPGALQAKGESNNALKMIYNALDGKHFNIMNVHLMLVLNFIYWLEADISELLIRSNSY